MHDSVIIRQPDGPAGELVLLFHGVGSAASDLVPLGKIVADAMPQAMVVSVNAPHPSSLGRGREWFSVMGVTEQSRPARVAEAMGAFADTVAHWQHEAGVAPAHTTLIGFSQGAIMSLESARREPVLAGRIVSLSGRFAAVPDSVPASIDFHFIHGAQDPVISLQHAVAAEQELGRLGAPVTLDVVPGLGHGVDARVAAILVERLKDGLAQRQGN
jgi:phospholipase/carboxylesterase